MRRSDFHFELPDELIAQAPLPERGGSRLLVLDGESGALSDRTFADLPSLLNRGDLLVLNDTRVLPARLHVRKSSGGRVELLLERLLGARRALFQLKASHKPKPGSELELPGDARARVIGRDGALFELELDRDVVPFLETHGRDAAAAVHRARRERRRPRALPDRVRARARRRGGADRGPAFRACDASKRSQSSASSARF